MGGVILLRITPGITWTQPYIYMRWVQVIPSVTLKSYTFFKPLNLSRSNGQNLNPSTYIYGQNLGTLT